MKLHFESDLPYQRTAIEAVADLFRGQEICRTEFTVTRQPLIARQGELALEGVGYVQGELGLAQNALGIGNRLTLLDDEILANLNEIQIRNGMRPSSALASGDFTVEMETGTGKTYVYLRTIFELNRSYGFTKFVIVVPSVAIKEGVYKTLQMIRRTIKEHLDKEKRLRPLGIKVLSLFFIGVVAHYRIYTADGQPQKGKYAIMFEEEYRRLATHPDYLTLFKEVDLDSDASEVHGGYFSIDKKKVGGRTVEEFKDTRGDSKADDDTYNLIMRDKEKLLSLDTRLKFIFSHSALREGWDNPNVFQICALREMGTERERRQTIGRGLRLCVNQDGERLRGFDINTLTVIATESYEQFAENLQKEIEEDTGIRFGIVEEHQFAGIAITDDMGKTVPLGFEHSKAIWNHLKAAGYVDAKGKVQNTLRTALKENKVTIPERFEAQLPQVVEILRKLAGKLEIKDADQRVPIKTRQAILDSEGFKALWDRIKHKTTYRVYFDNDKLISDCARALRDAPAISKTRLQIRKADLAIGKAGVTATETASGAPVTLDEADIGLPDVLTDLQDKTQLTRRSIVRILTTSDRLDDFKRNPQQFIELAAEAINRAKRMALVDGIKYQRIGEQEYYAQELFAQEELRGYLKDSMEASKSPYERVIYDSTGIERSFAEEMEKSEAVKLYAKLPGWFKVATPLGGYNPDWAVLIEKDGTERLYFVVETKGSLFKDDLRGIEGGKIQCGKAHFKALAEGDDPARYIVATQLDDLMMAK